MSDIYRRCGCRREDGKLYAPLPYGIKLDEPEAQTPRQRAQIARACPLLLVDKKHGSYGILVHGGTHSGTGRRVRVREMGFPTLREAQQRRAEVVQQIGARSYRPPSRLKVGEYLERWIEQRTLLPVEPLRPSTARMYAKYIRDDIVPAIGALYLDRVTRDDLQEFIYALVRQGRGATTVRRIHAVLSSALTAARKRELIAVNPAAGLELPRPVRERTRVWEPEDAGAFLDAVAHHRLGPVFEVAMFTGLRRGELAGLQWADIDVTNREIVVRRQRVQLGGQVVEGPVKTEAGQERRAPLGSEALAALMAWRLQQDQERAAWAEAYSDGGYVFTYEDGHPLRPAYISRVFDDLREGAGLPHLSLHGLRHQYASLMLASGADIALVSKVLGHSNIAITSDLYTHLIRSAGHAAAEAAEAIVPPRKNPRPVVSIRVAGPNGRTLATQDPLPVDREGVSDPEKPGIMRRGG